MSNDENSNKSEESTESVSETVSEAVESTTNAAGNIVSKILDLKQSNPKVFYGGIGALVLIVIILMMMGGGSNKNLPVTSVPNISIDQSYELRGVNTLDPNAPVKLVPVPGSISAFDEEKTDDAGTGCNKMPQGTKVKAIQFQEAFGNVKFVQVEILGGECAGKKGWVISNNLK